MGNIRIIPPGERVESEFLEQAEDGEKGGNADYEVDEVAVLGSGSDCVDG